MVLPPDGGMAHFSFMSSRFLEICGLDRKAAEENPFNAFACVHRDDYEEWVRKNANLLLKSTKADGSGLGLYIVHTTMENHSGHLEIGRSPLGGAEFRMVFGK